MKKWTFVAAVGLLLLLAICSGGQSATKRFRVIATAEVDGQKVEGSTVMEITYEKVEHSLIGRGGATAAAYDPTRKSRSAVRESAQRGEAEQICSP
jgi:hypothetical protein